DAQTLELLERNDAASLTQRGPLTPDHVIRTKQRPLWVPAKLCAPEALAAELGALLAQYEADYQAYFERGSANSGQRLERLDALPRVLLFPGLGALCAGQSLAAARVVADLYEHTARVILAASALGDYQPVAERDLFEVEYWSLEQAKLGKSKSSAPLEAQVAIVTGAARGIGLATAKKLLERGAHVLLSDRDGEALDASAAALGKRFGKNRVSHLTVDVVDPEATRALCDRAVDAFGGLDIVVSNAGSAPSGLLHEPEGDRALSRSLQVNLLGHQNVARAASQLLRAQGSGGVLLFNASKSAFNPGPEFGPYAVAKAAL